MRSRLRRTRVQKGSGHPCPRGPKALLAFSPYCFEKYDRVPRCADFIRPHGG